MVKHFQRIFENSDLFKTLDAERWDRGNRKLNRDQLFLIYECPMHLNPMGMSNK